MIFTVFTKDNRQNSNEATKHFHGTSICAFQTMKSIDDGIARRSSQNDLAGTVSDFFLPQSYTNVAPLQKKCKEYSCALLAINIQEDIWCELILKDHQNEENIWTENFLSAETTAKHVWSLYHAGNKRVPTPTPSNSSIFPLLKDVVHTPDMQHHLIKLCIEYRNTLNPQQVTAVDCSDQPIYALSKIFQWKYPEFYQKFERGKFCCTDFNREFSRIHYDQAHEQSNKIIKSIKGPIDFVNRASDELQRRWESAGPEIAEYLE